MLNTESAQRQAASASYAPVLQENNKSPANALFAGLSVCIVDRLTCSPYVRDKT